MARLELQSPSDLIRLDSVLQIGKGVEALSGVTGLGLPTLDSQYTTGAGDGASFRYQRVKERDIDIPLYISGDNHAEMQDIWSRLVIALAQPCVLRFVEDNGMSWILDVRLNGGGSYVYGKDNTERDLLTVVTVRAGDPYWRSEAPVSFTLADKQGGIVALDNSGDAPARPIITLTGPGMAFEAISPNGEQLAWQGILGIGETLTIDYGTRTLVDGMGRNRYAELDVAPRFWDLPPGESDVTLGWDIASDEFRTALGQGKFNYITNPTFHFGLAGWTRKDITLFSSNGPTVEISTQPSSDSPDGSLRIYMKGKGRVVEYTTQLVGLTIGETYRVGGTLVWNTHSKTKRNLPPYLRVGDKRVSLASNAKNKVAFPISMTFVADATTMEMALGSGSTKNDGYSNITWAQLLYVTEGDDGSYFTGDTPDSPGKDYSWTGTAHASKSKRTVPGTVDTTTTQIRVGWTPRRWAMT